MTKFEEIALDHKQHRHCIGCGLCMLDPRIASFEVNPVWCIGCMKRIDAAMPKEILRPWFGGILFA